MEHVIRKAAVIGAGSMGSGIAGQFANAGIPVVLLDVAGPAGGPRDAVAAAGVERQRKAGGFMRPDRAALVRTGTVEDDIGLLADADWIVEAVIENLAIKRDLFRRVDAARKPGSAVTSNTSTILLSAMMEGMSPALVGDFAVTHFFNPPRHMRLLEIVAGAGTRPAVLERLCHAAEAGLGKTTVDCRDTPGFIGNRIGCFWIALGLLSAIEAGLTVEEADTVAGVLFKVPRTGLFGLIDLIGLDLIPHVWGSLYATLPPDDALHRFDIMHHPLFQAMIAAGQHGRKAGGGFYKVEKGRPEREALDLVTRAYRPERAVKLESRDPKALCERTDAIGRFAWTAVRELVAYASTVAPVIAADVGAIDTAMELGYGWAVGPFGLADRLGADWIVGRMADEGHAVPALLAQAAREGGFHRGGALRTDGSARLPARLPPGSLAALRHGAPVFATPDATLWDIGDGVACLEIHTKLNTVSPGVIDAIGRAIPAVSADFAALVIGNDDPRAFSAGADLTRFVALVEAGDWAALSAFIESGQIAYDGLLDAPFPVVGAAAGLALGGGCELLLHCDAVVAHAELNAGLPEAKVGIIPGWGGILRLLQRWTERGAPDPARAVFDLVVAGRVSRSALEAEAMGILRPTDTIVMARSLLLPTARRRALELVPGYRPAPRPALPAREPAAPPLLLEGAEVSDHDRLVAGVVAAALTDGGAPTPPTEAAISRREREGGVSLSQTAPTRARIAHMLKTGKPLRN